MAEPFFSTTVEADSYLWAVARYIEQNPVKSKLVISPEDYRWSSCRANISGQGDGLVAVKGGLDENGLGAYKIFLMQQGPATDQKIRANTSTGRPMGSEGFIVGLGEEALPKVIARQDWAPAQTERYLIWEVSLVFCGAQGSSLVSGLPVSPGIQIEA